MNYQENSQGIAKELIRNYQEIAEEMPKTVNIYVKLAVLNLNVIQSCWIYKKKSYIVVFHVFHEKRQFKGQTSLVSCSLSAALLFVISGQEHEKHRQISCCDPSKKSTTALDSNQKNRQTAAFPAINFICKFTWISISKGIIELN